MDASNKTALRVGSPSALSETSSTLTVFSRTPSPPTSPSFRSARHIPRQKDSHNKLAGKDFEHKMATNKYCASHSSSNNIHTVLECEDLWREPEPVHDPLLERPCPNFTYIDENDKLRDPNKYSYGRPAPHKRLHPKLSAHKKNFTITAALRLYYGNMPPHRVLPIAGIIHEFHFNALFRDHLLTDNDFQEEGFHQRPSIKLIISDHLKAILVDDWENVTKNQQLVPLPAAHPVNSILADYLAFEKPKRTPGSPQADILEEVVAGLKEYFDKCLGRILLYR
jgi:MRG